MATTVDDLSSGSAAGESRAADAGREAGDTRDQCMPTGYPALHVSPQRLAHRLRLAEVGWIGCISPVPQGETEVWLLAKRPPRWRVLPRTCRFGGKLSWVLFAHTCLSEARSIASTALSIAFDLQLE